MNKPVTKFLSLFTLLVLLITTQQSVYAQMNILTTPPPPDASVKEKINYLLTQYDQAVEKEFQQGETKQNETGNIILTGNSEIKIQKLWQDVFRQIDELTVRPVEERAKVINYINALEKSDQAEYSFHTSMPFYGTSIPVEIYNTSKYRYIVDVNTGDILGVDPLDQSTLYIETGDLKDELQTKVVEYIQSLKPDIDLDSLSLTTKGKTGVLFFRWEDQSKSLADNNFPFVQVGISLGGNILTYVNVLNLHSAPVPSAFSSPFLFSATAVLLPSPSIIWSEIYANGGSYWSVTGSYYSTAGGYCYSYPTYCPGTFTDKSKYYYKATVTGTTGVVKGTWSANTNYLVEAQAWIPCYNATLTSAKYEIFTGSSVLNYYVNQNIYCDTFALVTYSPLNTIKSITLRNKASSTSYLVAWDEMQIWSDNSW